MTQFFTQNSDIIIKLVLSMTLGMVIGIERYVAHKTAGMRTYALVAMGSALLIIISELMVLKYLPFSNISINPFQIAAAVITGMGFLGAGVILHQESRIIGITSASGLWVAASIGIAVGFGLYDLAIIATILALFIFIVLWFLEKKIIDRISNKFDGK
ncbi:MAG: MgtC/SapB family protein [Candidatus Nomurabacteria bacterium]|nr:MgtC/SapB family protein [Candidatus Nomurabacteria bacterium]